MIVIKKNPLLLPQPHGFYCKCGCKQEIPFNKWQLRNGVPNYLPFHSPNQKEASHDNIKYLIELAKRPEHHNKGRKHTELSCLKKSSSQIAFLSKQIDISVDGKYFLKNGSYYYKDADGNIKRHQSEETRMKQSIKRLGTKDPEWVRKKKSYARIGDKNPQWEGGISFFPYCQKFNKTKKEEIRNKYNRTCGICGKPESENCFSNGKLAKLSVHHINRDKDQGCNGRKWELIPLCISCHRKQHNGG